MCMPSNSYPRHNLPVETLYDIRNYTVVDKRTPTPKVVRFHCVSCGAPLVPSESACSYCKTPT